MGRGTRRRGPAPTKETVDITPSTPRATGPTGRALHLLVMALVPFGCLPEPVGSPASCEADVDCHGGNPCNGARCDGGSCTEPEPVVCDEATTCVVSDGAARCEALCALPLGPLVEVLHRDDPLTFPDDSEVSVTSPGEPLTFRPGGAVDLTDRDGPTRVVARTSSDACDPDADVFDLTYDVRGTYPSPVEPDPAPVVLDDPSIRGWADEVVSHVVGEEVDDVWLDPAGALGPADGDPLQVLSLGRGGEVVLHLEVPARDAPGPDVAVFENGISAGFLELARVEVSTDGVVFAPFGTLSRLEEAVGAYDPLEPGLVHGVAGAWASGLGTPFDLGLLTTHPLVRSGQVDLQAIHYLRIVDIVGDGSDRDAFGRPLYDPFPTVGSAGFDLDGVAVLGGP